MKTTALGYCGLNCEECPVFIATAYNDDNLRQKTSKEWSKFYGDFITDDLKPQNMNCCGCRSETSLFEGCMNCPIRKCCREKKFITCADCGAYETCGILNGFFAYHHQHAKDNLDRIRMKL